MLFFLFPNHFFNIPDDSESPFCLGPTTSYRPHSLDVIPAPKASVDPQDNNIIMPFPQLLPLTAQQIFVQQLMAAATLASQQQNNLREIKCNEEAEPNRDEIPKAVSKGDRESEKREWNEEKNKSHKMYGIYHYKGFFHQIVFPITINNLSEIQFHLTVIRKAQMTILVEVGPCHQFR